MMNSLSPTKNISTKTRRRRQVSTNAFEKNKVHAAFEFVSIGEIDTLNEKFQAEVIIESRWRIDIDEEDIDDFDSENYYDPRRNWNPQLYVENALAVKEEIIYEISEESDGFYVTEIRSLAGLFWAKLILNHFPVDVQELSIVLTSKIGSDQLELVSDLQKLSFIVFDATLTFRDQQKWRLFRLVTTSDQASYDSEKKTKLEKQIKLIKAARKKFKPPKMVAKCYAARRPGFYLFNAFFLVFLITAIAFSIFAINYYSPHFRLQSTFTILLTSVSFKWVVNRSLPAISYLTSLDAYQISSICFICLLATWHGIVGAPRLLTAETALETDKWMLLSFGICFILMQVAFLVWFYYAYDKIREIKAKEEAYCQEHKEHFMLGQPDNIQKITV